MPGFRIVRMEMHVVPAWSRRRGSSTGLVVTLLSSLVPARDTLPAARR